jgi:anti-sigma B factor antagonist
MDNITVEILEYLPNKDITLLAVKGDIDLAAAPEFEKKFVAVLLENKFKLVVDLKDVNYICSAGWGIFIREIRRIRDHRGDLVLVGMREEVAEVFKLFDFHAILKSFPNVESALKKAFQGLNQSFLGPDGARAPKRVKRQAPGMPEERRGRETRLQQPG